MQSYHPAPTNGNPIPPKHSYSAFERETTRANGGNGLLDPFLPRPQPSGANITSAPLQSERRGEQREVLKRSRHSSAWPFTSPPTIAETTVREPSTHQGDDPTDRDCPIPGPKSDKRMSYIDMSSRPGPFLAPNPAPQRAVSADLYNFKGAQRLDAFLALEGTNPRARLLSQGGSSGSHGEEKHIATCGKRLYSEWTGSWSKLISLSCVLFTFQLSSY